jgi:uncharacterized protein YdhG (YjbR/CyaY superfamily)
VKPAGKASKTSMTQPKDVEAYIAAAPKAVQPMLKELRQVIRAAAPLAEEKISYGMPSYMQHGRVAYFAGYEGHVGLYGVAHVASAHDDEVAKYLESQSTLRFPVGKRLPVALIKKLVVARVKQNEASR